jgi:hypothetical protein
MELPSVPGWLRWPARWLRAMAALPRLHEEVEAMKQKGGDPLRCTACGKRLTVTAIDDIHSISGSLMGERLALRCDTPACVFTPRKRDVMFDEGRT